MSKEIIECINGTIYVNGKIQPPTKKRVEQLTQLKNSGFRPLLKEEEELLKIANVSRSNSKETTDSKDKKKAVFPSLSSNS